MFGSVTFSAMSSSLDALSLRQRTIAENIANIQTPGYQARRVQFEDTLQAAVANGTGSFDASIGVSLEPTQLNGNNVNLDTETISNIDTGLRYTLASNAVSHQFSLMRTAIGS